MKCLAFCVWQLLLFIPHFLGNCLATAPSKEAWHPEVGRPFDDAPDEVATATRNLATEVNFLDSREAKSSLKFRRLRLAAVPGVAVRTSVGEALGRLQKGLEQSSTSLTEYAKANNHFIPNIALASSKDYTEQQDDVVRARHVLANFLNASHQRQAEQHRIVFGKLEATQKKLELEIQQRRHDLEKARAKTLKQKVEREKEEQNTGSDLHVIGGANLDKVLLPTTKKLMQRVHDQKKERQEGSDLHLVGGLTLDKAKLPDAKKIDQTGAPSQPGTKSVKMESSMKHSSKTAARKATSLPAIPSEHSNESRSATVVQTVVAEWASRTVTIPAVIEKWQMLRMPTARPTVDVSHAPHLVEAPSAASPPSAPRVEVGQDLAQPLKTAMATVDHMLDTPQAFRFWKNEAAKPSSKVQPISVDKHAVFNDTRLVEGLHRYLAEPDNLKTHRPNSTNSTRIGMNVNAAAGNRAPKAVTSSNNLPAYHRSLAVTLSNNLRSLVIPAGKK